MIVSEPGTPNLDARQFVLFSARKNQSAQNRRSDDPDSFAATLFKALNEADAVWLPGLPTIANRVKEHFEELAGPRQN